MDDWYKKFNKHFEEEIAKSKVLPEGMVEGKIFRINVADGYAYYEVVKVNKKTVRIKWRKDLCMDEYQYFAWGEGGSFNKNLIETLIAGDEKLAKVFTKQFKEAHASLL